MAGSVKPEFPNLHYGLLHDLVGHLLRHSYNRAFSAFEATFRDEAITPLQFMIFELIERNPGVTHSDVAKAMGTAASVVTTTMKPLFAEGRVRSTPMPGDTRQRVYEVTPEGSAWFARLRPLIADSEDSLTEALSDAERAELLRMLRTLLGIGKET